MWNSRVFRFLTGWRTGQASGIAIGAKAQGWRLLNYHWSSEYLKATGNSAGEDGAVSLWSCGLTVGYSRWNIVLV